MYLTTIGFVDYHTNNVSKVFTLNYIIGNAFDLAIYMLGFSFKIPALHITVNIRNPWDKRYIITIN